MAVVVPRVAETSAWPAIIRHSRMDSNSALSAAWSPEVQALSIMGLLGVSGVSMAGLGMEGVDAIYGLSFLMTIWFWVMSILLSTRID